MKITAGVNAFCTELKSAAFTFSLIIKAPCLEDNLNCIWIHLNPFVTYVVRQGQKPSKTAAKLENGFTQSTWELLLKAKLSNPADDLRRKLFSEPAYEDKPANH